MTFLVGDVPCPTASVQGDGRRRLWVGGVSAAVLVAVAGWSRLRDRLPDAIRELVLDDRRLRNDIGWSVLVR